MGEMKRAIAREEAGTTEIRTVCQHRSDRGSHYRGRSSGARRYQFAVSPNLCCGRGQCQLGAQDPAASDRG